MKNNEIIFNMNSFVNSKEFKNKKVELINNKYVDEKTRVVYAVIVNNIDDIPLKDYDRNPVIYLSDDLLILNKLGYIFDSHNWDSKKINKLTGEEFDYIYLRQCNLLGIDKEVNKFRTNQ